MDTGVKTMNDIPTPPEKPLFRREYANTPEELQVVIRQPGGEVIFNAMAERRVYRTGSNGWMAAGKADVPGLPGVKMQVNVQLTIIGSKQVSDKGG